MRAVGGRCMRAVPSTRTMGRIAQSGQRGQTRTPSIGSNNEPATMPCSTIRCASARRPRSWRASQRLRKKTVVARLCRPRRKSQRPPALHPGPTLSSSATLPGSAEHRPLVTRRDPQGKTRTCHRASAALPSRVLSAGDILFAETSKRAMEVGDLRPSGLFDRTERPA